MNLVLICGIVFPAATAAPTAANKPMAIPTVRSLETLRTLDATWTRDSRDIRLGLADPGDQAGPWRLLYCHTKLVAPPGATRHVPPDEPAVAGSRRLGPVRFAVAPAGRPSAELPMTRRIKVLRHLPTRHANDAERLYVASIPANRRGTWQVTVWFRNHRPIARGTFTVKADTVCPWRAFAKARPAADRGPGKPLIVVRTDSDSRMPSYPRLAPIWHLKAGEQFQPPHAALGKAGFLPGQLPPIGGYEPRYFGGKLQAVKIGAIALPLRLSLERDRFVIRSHVPMIDWPDETLLARWWVNGRPCVSQMAQLESVKEISRKLRDTKQIDVAFALPDDLGKLKVGTKVTLQVMVCNDRSEPLRGQRQRLLHATLIHRWPAPQPLLSNRLTFPVTQAMLPARP